MTRFSALVAFVALVPVGLVGCDSNISTTGDGAGAGDPCGDQGCPDDGWTSDGGSGSGGSGSGGAPVIGQEGIAIRHGDLPSSDNALATTSIPEEDVDTMYLHFATNPLSCGDPSDNFGGGYDRCQPAYAALIPLTYGHQHVGTYPLSDLISNFSGSYFTLRGPNGNGECDYATSAFEGGTLEILEIDADHVKFSIEGSGIPEADGIRSVPHCGGKPITPHPQHAVALTQERLDEVLEPGTIPFEGDEPAPNRLIVFIDPAGIYGFPQCAEPISKDHCGVDMLAVALDEGRQMPGSYSMSDAGVNVSIVAGGSENPRCDGGGATVYTDGTVEVAASDASTITVRVVGGPLSSPKEATADRCQ